MPTRGARTVLGSTTRRPVIREAPGSADRSQIRVFHLFRQLGRAGAELLLVEGLRFADRRRFHYGYGYVLEGNGALPEIEEMGAPLYSFHATTRPGMLATVWRIARHLRGLVEP